MEWNLVFFINSVLLGVGLAMDAFSVSIANAFSESQMRKSRMCFIASVYAFFLSNDLVKIGHSDNIRERVNGVETRNKLTVKKIHFTADVARSIACFVEWACQKHFSSHRVKGEFFNIDFDEACKVIDSLMKIKTENNDKILTSLRENSPAFIGGGMNRALLLTIKNVTDKMQTKGGTISVAE